jgi:hypothetical protein
MPFSVEKLFPQFRALLADTLGIALPKNSWKDCKKKIEELSIDFGFDDPKHCIDWLLKTPLKRKHIEILARYFTNYSLRNFKRLFYPKLFDRKRKLISGFASGV